MFRIIVTLALIATCCVSSYAQDLLSPSFTFSHEKTTYVTLMDGTQIIGELKDLDRKKGLIEEVVIKDGDGKKHKLEPEDIKHMYLMPSGMDKLAKAVNTMTDAQKWTNEKLDQDLLNQGYVYFEQAEVLVKKKNLNLLMQLLNPDFSKEVKVYHDPLAKETMSLGIGPVDMVGGNAKSYYVSKQGATSFRLYKKDYDDLYSVLWIEGCASMKDEYETIRWNELTQHVISYSECVSK